MTSPIPLTDPEGRVWAYLCGNCHHQRGIAEVMADVTEPVENLVQMSLEQAERCCKCTKCGTPSSWNRKGSFYSQFCAECEAKEKVDEPRRQAELQSVHDKESAAYDEAIAKALDQDAALRLRDVMSGASEDVMCAGWLIGLEYTLWEALYSDEESEWSPYLAEIRRLSEKAGGWWYWADIGYGIELFVTLAEWRVKCLERMGSFDFAAVREILGDPPPIDFEKVGENLKAEAARIVGSLTPAEKAILEKRFGDTYDSSGGYEIVTNPDKKDKP